LILLARALQPGQSNVALSELVRAPKGRNILAQAEGPGLEA